jgi:uncharacterized repeat protein (TIGR03803 family)
VASVIDLHGTLWGTTLGGGDYGSGAVFNFTLGLAKFRKIFSFADPDQSPYGPLTLFAGQLFGDTEAGGAFTCAPYGPQCGTLYSIDPANGAERLVYSFDGADGNNAIGGLLGDGSFLYGVTSLGGAAGDGVVFKFDPATGQETVLHSFSGGADGRDPIAALVEFNGLLYGTTYTGGGQANFGSIYSVDPKTGEERVLYRFSGGWDGADPVGLVVYNGTLYGTTDGGGAAHGGTLYAFRP